MASEAAFAWEHLGQPWHAAVLLAAAAGAGAWVWRRYGPAAPGWWGRWSRLARTAGAVLLVVLLGGPVLRTTTTTWEPARLVVAVDRSASMARTDGPGSAPRAAAATALARLLAALPADRVAVSWQAVGDGVRPWDPADVAPPTGAVSRLAEDLDQVVADRRPDVLVVVTDGRATGAPLAGARLNPDGGRSIVLLGVGSEQTTPELFLDEVVANRDVPLGEVEPVRVRLSARGIGDAPVTVRILEDGRSRAETDVPVPGPSDPATLADVETVVPLLCDQPGDHLLTVEASVAGHTVRQDITMTVRERRLAVLLLDRTPRWETRYLAEALRRDGSASVHAYLGDGGWRRWGDDGPADRLPLQDGDLDRYDVLVLGDLDPGELSDVQVAAIDRAVRRRGAGLIWIPGETGAIAAWAGTPAEQLIPCLLPEAAAAVRGIRDQAPRTLVRTPVAERLGLMDPGDGASWAERPALLGGVPLGQAKPGAEVLATDTTGAAVVIDRPVGAGRTMIIGVDDTWRWRRGAGDAFLHRFHGQLLRHAAAGRWGDRSQWRLVATPRRAMVGERVVLALSPRGPDVEAATSPPTIRLIGPDQREHIVATVPDGDGFAARLPAPEAGGWRMEVVDGLDPRRVDATGLIVLPPQVELRDPRLDAQALAALAAASGGQVVADAAAAVAALPADPRQPRATTTVQGLWDTWWMLGLLVSLFAADWAIRRAHRLP
jgi:hypothetical protein